MIASGLQLNRRAAEVGARSVPVVPVNTPEADRLINARETVPVAEAPLYRKKRTRIAAHFALE